MNERYIRWWTPHLSREFEMLAFGDGGGIPLVLFPTSFGRHTQNKDFGLTDAIAGYVDSRQGHDLLSGLDRSRQLLQQGDSSRRPDADA